MNGEKITDAPQTAGHHKYTSARTDLIGATLRLGSEQKKSGDRPRDYEIPHKGWPHILYELILSSAGGVNATSHFIQVNLTPLPTV